jgi:hypothetical protein
MYSSSLEGAADVHLDIRGRNHLHLAHAAVDDVLGQVKLIDHAEGNGPAAGFGIV